MLFPYLLCWSNVPHWGCLVTTYLRISLLKLPYSCLLENFLIEAASWLLAWEFPHWGCLVAVYLRISSLGPHWNCLLEKFLFEAGGYLLENFLIGAASWPHTWEFPHWGCLAAAYLRISSLRLPCGCLLDHFLIEAVLWLLSWGFPHWGRLGTAYFRSFLLKLVAAHLRISSFRLPCDC